ncbi:MAG TPA: hypothetical protein VEC16_03785 [Alphaproteobacteria bacterium]|nr:hypothetical protein [Alphaproteobacteria bacterium]
MTRTYLTVDEFAKSHDENILGNFTYRQNPNGKSLENLYQIISANNMLQGYERINNIVRGIVAIKTLNDDIRSIDIFNTQYEDKGILGNNISKIPLNYRNVNFLKEKSIIVAENDSVIPIVLNKSYEAKILEFYSSGVALAKSVWSNQQGRVCVDLK